MAQISTMKDDNPSTTGLSLSGARQILNTIFSCPEIPPNSFQTVLKLCQAQPSLALESFVRNDNSQSLLTHLIEEGASLQVLQKFCVLFPASLEQIDEETGNSPLHTACNLAQPVEGLVAFMANQYPYAVSLKNSRGDLPLHLFLSSTHNPRPTLFLCDLQALVDIYPESTVMTSVDRKTTPADKVLEDLHISQDVREYICSHVPHCVRCFQLRASPSIAANKQVAHALSKLLPQLQSLECNRTAWDLEGWIGLLQALETNASIRNLSLVLPHNLAFVEYEAALQRVVEHNSSISKLTLYDNGVATSMRFLHRKDVTNVVVALLCHNVVQSLCLIGVHVEMSVATLTEALIHNTSLTEWNVEYCYTLCWEKLASFLNLHNTSLRKVMVPSSCLYRREILYLTALNRYGRESFRKISVTEEELFSLLACLNEQPYVIQQGMRVEMDQLRYGLLRETPSLWCSPLL